MFICFSFFVCDFLNNDVKALIRGDGDDFCEFMVEVRSFLTDFMKIIRPGYEVCAFAIPIGKEPLIGVFWFKEIFCKKVVKGDVR